jgi:hypothetical protein
VYRRADLSRTFVPVVALLLTAVSTGALARELPISDCQNEGPSIDMFHPRRLGAEKQAGTHIRIDAIGLDRAKFALIGTMTPVTGRLRRVERI